MAETVTGLVLLSAASAEPQSIPGLPGLWSTEAELSVVPADLALGLDDLRAQAEALGLDVEEVEWERATAEDEEGKEMTAAEIKAGIADFSDEDLAALADDDRTTVAAAARAEIERRAEPEPEDGS